MSNKPELIHKGTYGEYTFEIYRVAKTKNLDKGAFFHKFKVFKEFPAKDKNGRDIIAKDFAIPGFQIKAYVEALEFADNYAKTLNTGQAAAAVSSAAARVSGESAPASPPTFKF